MNYKYNFTKYNPSVQEKKLLDSAWPAFSSPTSSPTQQSWCSDSSLLGFHCLRSEPASFFLDEAG